MRRVKEFAQVCDYESIDAVIAQLVQIRDSLPNESEAVLRLKGCDVFGRSLQIEFMRPQTAEESATDARYAFNERGLRLAA